MYRIAGSALGGGAYDECAFWNRRAAKEEADAWPMTECRRYRYGGLDLPYLRQDGLDFGFEEGESVLALSWLG